MLSVPWFLGWALKPYIQVASPSTSVTISSDGRAVAAAADDSSSRLRAKAQVAQLSSPSAARHVTLSSRTPSPTSPSATSPSATHKASTGPYPVNTQPIIAKAEGQQTRSAPPPSPIPRKAATGPPPPSPTPITKTTTARTAAAPNTAPKPSAAQGAVTPTDQQGPGTLVSTKTINLKMSAEWAQQQLETFRFSFDEADRDRNGFLSFDEVLQVISKQGFRGSKDQAKELFAQLDADNDQRLTRQEFSVALDKLPRASIREFALRKTFQRMDKDGSGKLSRQEIEEAARGEAGLDVPPQKMAQLLSALGKDSQDKAVDYEKFLQVFGVHTTGDVLQEIFQKLDTDHSGYLTKQEILAAIHAEHELKLRAARISDLLIAWHKDDDQKINYREFIQVWTRYKN